MELDNLLNNIVAVAALAGLAGLGLGILLTYLFIGRGPSKTELTGKLAAVEEEFAAHKDNVDKHFETTSELVNDLTESYVKVYQHLSQGAEQLSGVVDMRNRLTLDDAEDTSPVIEGAVATAAVAVAGTAAAGDETGANTAADAVASHVEDPEFTVSDAAVEETLTELEANAATQLNTPAADDSAAADAPTEEQQGKI